MVGPAGEAEAAAVDGAVEADEVALGWEVVGGAAVGAVAGDELELPHAVAKNATARLRMATKSRGTVISLGLRYEGGDWSPYSRV